MTRFRMLTVVVLVIAMAIGGILTTQRVIATGGASPGLILDLLGGAALLGVVFAVIALLGLRARRNPGKTAPVIAPRLPK